jgi:hypothetical protein
MVSASTSTAAASGALLASGLRVLSLLGIREQTPKRVLYDGDCFNRHKCYLAMVVAGQMRVNDLVTILYFSLAAASRKSKRSKDGTTTYIFSIGREGLSEKVSPRLSRRSLMDDNEHNTTMT